MDNLFNASPPTFDRSGAQDDRAHSDYVDFFTEDTSPAVLRMFLREHVLWLFAAAGLAAAAFLIPSTPWYLGLPRFLLFLVALLVGGLRLFQINGIIDEFHRRNETAQAGTSPQSHRTT